ncbi:hypothetical protein I4000191A8_06620 [Clostridia bacterium i40-0019-1A8]
MRASETPRAGFFSRLFRCKEDFTMDENNCNSTPQEPSGNFKEAVCIDAMRIYDSCSE